MRDPARAYRELSARAASPVGLVAVLYEDIVRSLRRALDAVQRNNIERRTLELSRAILVIGYLQSVLDYEKGGEIAQRLSDFYNSARSRILECSGPNAQKLLESLAAEFSDLDIGWQEIDHQISQQAEPELVAAAGVPARLLRRGESRRARMSR
ncbi:MAG TPA: flagellar export chaperone FliS [Candidatus Dormibacteraeota bacterium]|nr:flagellar export chaperone FliS [Candidatus Dormibacteraeota bacterium]